MISTIKCQLFIIFKMMSSKQKKGLYRFFLDITDFFRYYLYAQPNSDGCLLYSL